MLQSPVLSGIVLFCALLALLELCTAHPPFHEGYDPFAYRWNASSGEFPPVISWHVHIAYNVFDHREVARALELREKATAHFAAYLGEPCTARYDSGRICMIHDHDLNSQLLEGPYPSGEWSMMIPDGYFKLVVPWFMLNRGEFSLYVHPNTGFEWEDHALWAVWGGQQWPINMNIFIKEVQTTEFGHSRGDAENPICLSSGATCGESKDDTPSAICCFNLACKCPQIKSEEKASPCTCT